MKAWKAAGVVAVASAVALGTAGSPAQAAQTYTIKASKVLFGAEDGFTNAKCDARYLTSPLNGISSVVVDISSRAGLNVPASWSADRRAANVVGGSLRPNFYNGDCTLMASVTEQTGTPGAWTLKVPAGAKWLVIESLYSFDVRVTF